MKSFVILGLCIACTIFVKECPAVEYRYNEDPSFEGQVQSSDRVLQPMSGNIRFGEQRAAHTVENIDNPTGEPFMAKRQIRSTQYEAEANFGSFSDDIFSNKGLKLDEIDPHQFNNPNIVYRRTAVRLLKPTF